MQCQLKIIELINTRQDGRGQGNREKMHEPTNEQTSHT